MGTTAYPGVRLPGGIKLPDRYIVRHRIANGGMASVWCAEDRILGRPVAIKLLSEPYAHDAGAVLRFKREARAAARLSSHPNVVTVFDVGEVAEGSQDDPRRAFIVMAYLEGGSVADAMRSGPVNRTETLKWIKDTSVALDYANQRGVLHRDVKPENLLLDRDRVVHVADFGIARIATETPITQSGQVLGTAAYLAPERMVGEPATEASDRYSLAMVAFELLTGNRPFETPASGSHLHRPAEDQAPVASQLNPTLPRGVDAVLARGMARSPEDRWPSAAAFAAALEEAAGPALTVATAPLPIRRTAVHRPRPAAAYVPPPRKTAPVRAPRERRRFGRVVALLALGAVVLAVAVVALARQGGQAPSSATTHKSATVRSQHHATHRAAARTSTQASVPSTTASSAPAIGSPGAGSASSTPAATPSTAGGAGPSGLETQGHQLMLDGNYSAAIPILRQAIAAASPQDVVYAYALYDLGRSLRLAGDPRAAIPILERRMRIPNQLPTVAAELAAARRSNWRPGSVAMGIPAASWYRARSARFA
nr:serine/threonine-protein kinase [Actinomycetota bacterium]